MLQSIKKTANGLVALFKDGTSVNLGAEFVAQGSATAYTSGQKTDGGCPGLILNKGIYLIQTQALYSPGGDTAFTLIGCGYALSAGNVNFMGNYVSWGEPSADGVSKQIYSGITRHVVGDTPVTFYAKSQVNATRSTGTLSNSITAWKIG